MGNLATASIILAGRGAGPPARGPPQAWPEQPQASGPGATPQRPQPSYGFGGPGGWTVQAICTREVPSCKFGSVASYLRKCQRTDTAQPNLRRRSCVRVRLSVAEQSLTPDNVVLQAAHRELLQRRGQDRPEARCWAGQLEWRQLKLQVRNSMFSSMSCSAWMS